MKEKIKKWWNDFKTFDWKMYLALCLLTLVPKNLISTLGLSFLTTNNTINSIKKTNLFPDTVGPLSF